MEMNVTCLFCQDAQDSSSALLLARNKEKFENVMEGCQVDFSLVRDTFICQKCNTIISYLFDFKSVFMEKEDELLDYIDEEHKVDLCNVLITKGELEETSNIDEIKVCRICFNAIDCNSYKQIHSFESSLAKIVSTCLPEFDMFITGTIFICSKCETDLRKYFDFIQRCSMAIKKITSQIPEKKKPGRPKKTASLEVSVPTIPLKTIKKGPPDKLKPLSNTREQSSEKNRPIDKQPIKGLIMHECSDEAQATDLIEIDSDTDTEFVESEQTKKYISSESVVKEVVTLNATEASELISKGMPVFRRSELCSGQIEAMLDQNREVGSLVKRKNENETCTTTKKPKAARCNMEGNITKMDNKSTTNKASKTIRNNTEETEVQDECIEILDNDPEETESPNIEDINIDNLVLNKEAECEESDEDDCVIFIESEENAMPRQVKTNHAKKSRAPRSKTASTTNKIKKPHNAYQLFALKIKEEIKKKFSNLTKNEQRKIVSSTWRKMLDRDKWPFIEEARLLRLLFKREHPELCQKQVILAID